MEMIKNEYLTNLPEISTDIVRMRMDQEFWLQQHTLDCDAHLLNNHMIDMVLQYMRGDETLMETYIKLSSLVTSTNIARQYLPEASWPLSWKLFDLSMQISMTYLMMHVTLHRSSHWRRSQSMILSDHSRPSRLSWIWRGQVPTASTGRPHSRLTRKYYLQTGWLGWRGDCHLQRRDFQIEHQPSHSGGVFNRDMRWMGQWQVYQLYWYWPCEHWAWSQDRLRANTSNRRRPWKKWRKTLVSQHAALSDPAPFLLRRL